MLQPLVEQFMIDNPNVKSKTLAYWTRDTKKAQVEDSLVVPTLAIKGSPEIKGTYFHPSVVSEVLAWVSVDLKKMIFAIFEDATIQENKEIYDN